LHGSVFLEKRGEHIKIKGAKESRGGANLKKEVRLFQEISNDKKKGGQDDLY